MRVAGSAIALAIAWALALPVRGEVPPGSEPFLLTSREAERVELPGGVRSFEAFPMQGLVEIAAKQPDRLERALRQKPPQICPTVEREGDLLRLRCVTTRFDVRLVAGALDLRSLRGLPWNGDHGTPPLLPWHDGPCDGASGVVAGECAIARRDWKAAARAFRSEKERLDHATVRLGDLALLEDRPDEAARRWRSVDSGGPFGQVASARLCELLGNCLVDLRAPQLFDPATLPPELRPESILRAARMEAFIGDPRAAARYLVDALEDHPIGTLCPPGVSICAEIVEAALASPGLGEKEDALALYFALPDRLVGPAAPRLALQAARVAADLGAPVFAGNLLAATSGLVPRERLEAHLLLAADLYLRGGDPARAGVILDYARFRFGEKAMKAEPWSTLALQARSAGGDGRDAVEALAQEARSDDALARELAQALVAAARARTLATSKP